MDGARRHYEYVGPADLLAEVRPGGTGQPIESSVDLVTWLAAQHADESTEPFTYIVGLDGLLRLAPRRSEHVVCAGGAAVLGAGEIAFELRRGVWVVDSISNQSTGYCPDPDSWFAVADTLDLAGLAHPGQFTDPVVFRSCPHCRQRNLVKDEHFYCAVCDTELPRKWNFDPLESH
ncbi:hypothetical protein [Nocardia sp. NPDC049149]|uniref:hypothetical protein n=1 Tax=Nocardia sp. NPDC049149 TaxID=3364315 RepID=UPI003712C003